MSGFKKYYILFILINNIYKDINNLLFIKEKIYKINNNIFHKVI